MLALEKHVGHRPKLKWIDLPSHDLIPGPILVAAARFGLAVSGPVWARLRLRGKG